MVRVSRVGRWASCFGLVAVGLLMFADGASAAKDTVFRESVAQLRVAQQAVAQGQLAAAKAAYSALFQRPDIPAHHRWEAEGCLREIERAEKGLPARDPAATHITLPGRPKAAVSFYVAADGNDAHSGTKEEPFQSLERARDAIRGLQRSGGLPTGGVEVRLRRGQYHVKQTFELTATDSGTEQSPIVYRALEGKAPIFCGGIRLAGFRPVSDANDLARLPEPSRSKVLCADLKALGVKEVKPLELGGFASGRGFTTHPSPELFFNGQAMPLARWPNRGYASIHDIVVHDGKPIHGPAGSKTGRFQYEGHRPERWLKENDAWLYGYWFWGWADSYERIASIDPAKQEIALTPPFSTYGYRKGQPFYAVNMLAEIDMPGEWYLDRANSVLYFWPPSDPDRAVLSSFPSTISPS